MLRIAEPELMEDAAQTLAYAQADFSAPHQHFIELFDRCFAHTDQPISGKVLDLGCGPADITLRFARAYPTTTIIGLDGSAAMLALGRQAVLQQGLDNRIELKQVYLPAALGKQTYDIIISNSLLHHLADPMTLWQTIGDCATKGKPVFIMDLLRPDSNEAARALVNQYAANEAQILQQDFYQSLLAAYRPDEIKAQLKKAGLDLIVETVSDRHMIIYNRLTELN